MEALNFDESQLLDFSFPSSLVPLPPCSRFFVCVILRTRAPVGAPKDRSSSLGVAWGPTNDKVVHGVSGAKDLLFALRRH
jgi:hypothetical protein